MAQKCIQIIVFISVAGSMVFALKEELDGITPQIPSSNQTREIIWSDCKQEVVNDTENWYDFNPSLKPISDETLRHVALRSASRLEYMQMQIGLHASHYACILLSPEQEPKDKFYYYIGINRFDAYLRSLNDSVGHVLTRARTRTPMNRAQPAAPVLLTVSDDTLQLRHESSVAPFLEYRDARFADLKYFGFCSNYNNGGQASIYYDC